MGRSRLKAVINSLVRFSEYLGPVAPTTIKLEPSSNATLTLINSVTIFVASPWFSAKRALNSV